MTVPVEVGGWLDARASAAVRSGASHCCTAGSCWSPFTRPPRLPTAAALHRFRAGRPNCLHYVGMLLPTRPQWGGRSVPIATVQRMGPYCVASTCPPCSESGPSCPRFGRSAHHKHEGQSHCMVHQPLLLCQAIGEQQTGCLLIASFPAEAVTYNFTAACTCVLASNGAHDGRAAGADELHLR